MKTRLTPLPATEPPGFPDAGELAVRPAVERYQPSAPGDGQSARGVLGRIRRSLIDVAQTVHRDDLAAILAHPVAERARHAKAVAHAIELLRTAKPPEPQITDAIAPCACCTPTASRRSPISRCASRAGASGGRPCRDWARPVRFLLDFRYATGLRASELIGATLGHVETDPRGDHWQRVTGKGGKVARVALPPLTWETLARYLAERGLPVLPVRWNPQTPVIGSLEAENYAAISGTRLWMVMRRFFVLAAEAIDADHAPLAEKLRRASPHWMRHTHATHALGRGAELTTVRDNLRHASVSTTSIYLHSDEVKRARQMGEVFARTT
jgi:hypothetical protein